MIHADSSRVVAAKSGRPELLGSTVEEAARVDQWSSYVVSEFAPSLARVYATYNHWLPYDPKEDATRVASIDRVANAVNRAIEGRKFVAAEYLTLADLFLCSYLAAAFKLTIDADRRAKWPNLQPYFERVATQEKLKTVYGPPVYVEKAGYVPKKD